MTFLRKHIILVSKILFLMETESVLSLFLFLFLQPLYNANFSARLYAK